MSARTPGLFVASTAPLYVPHFIQRPEQRSRQIWTPTRRAVALVEDDDRAELLSLRHDGERVLDLVELDPPGHHLIQVEAAVAVPVRQQPEVARAQAIAVPAGLYPPPLVPQ